MRLQMRSFSTRSSLILAVLATAALAAAMALTGCGGSSSDNNQSGGSSQSGLPDAKASLSQVSRGQTLVTSLGCSDCHNRGKDDPADPKWLAGYIGAAGGQGLGTFNIGPFHTYCPNITPDAVTGIGSLSDRQIYNALKNGLDPKDTPDAVITGTTPGQGNFPAAPHYLAPPMPWPAFRHLSDSDLWAVVSYIKHGVKPVSNVVPDSQGPPDHWAGAYTSDSIGPAGIPAYPSGNEQFAP